MKCNKCGCECVGFPTGDPKEDVCSDCAYPEIKSASDAACEAVEINHWRRTGEFKTAGELLRKAIGIVEINHWRRTGEFKTAGELLRKAIGM